jgi:hydroxypyruvate reductase
VLVSGGGSSLLALPVEGVPMADLKAVTRALLASGAPIQDMNTVRKHLSRIQGGRLALATRARVHALVISDVTGDDPTHIASGPCAADPTTFADAAGILERFGVAPPASIASHLRRARAARSRRRPSRAIRASSAPRTTSSPTRITASPRRGLLRGARIPHAILGDTVTGESARSRRSSARSRARCACMGIPRKRPSR